MPRRSGARSTRQRTQPRKLYLGVLAQMQTAPRTVKREKLAPGMEPLALARLEASFSIQRR